MIYAFLNQKGGVGKTTLSLHVASALARSKQRVLLIDADPQQSAMKWSTVRSGPVDFAVIGMAKATLHKEIVSLGANYDHVVIDGPPRVTARTLDHHRVRCGRHPRSALPFRWVGGRRDGKSHQRDPHLQRKLESRNCD